MRVFDAGYQVNRSDPHKSKQMLGSFNIGGGLYSSLRTLHSISHFPHFVKAGVRVLAIVPS